MRFATDTGGTFTDLIVEDDDGGLSIFKAPTFPTQPVLGVLAAFDVAAAARGMDRRSLLARGSTFIHGTTHAINAIVTKRTARTALLVTEGHPDILVLREGGRLQPFNHAVAYPEPYISRSLTYEVPERILADGAIKTPLDESAVVAIAVKLREAAVEAVAVCLLWSVVDPRHEKRVGEILREHLPGVPVTLSHELNPSLREYRRAIATAIDASLKPLMTRYLGGLAAAMREAGFEGQILLLTSQGSMVDIDEVQRAPILLLNSGPSMAPIAGTRVAADLGGEHDVIVFDTGGTTFDVSLVRDGRVPFTHETWLGLPYQSDLTGFPSVDVRSIGAGGGSIAWVDEGGVLHVGPQSAGASPGPACYGAGGDSATVTDAALVLGYIDADYFLGGRIHVDRAAAVKAVTCQIAAPLNLTLEQASAAIMDVWTENMVQAIADITVNQGIDPAKAIVIGGGGAAGLNATAIASRIGCDRLAIPDVGAALSAAGAAVSDVGRDFRRIFVTNTERFDREGAASVLADLKAKTGAFASAAGARSDDVRTNFAVEARYAHQVWEIDVAIDPNSIVGEKGAAALTQAFHRAHEQIFAFFDPGSIVEVIAWRAAVRCAVSRCPDLRLARGPEEKRDARSRRAYFSSAGWVDVPVLDFHLLAPGETAIGPAIVESPYTCVVIDPGARYAMGESGNLVVFPIARSSRSIDDSLRASA